MNEDEIRCGLKMDDNVSSNSELVTKALVSAKVFHDFANHFIETGELKKVI
jgi:hypothetical protein